MDRTQNEAILWIQNKDSNWYTNYHGIAPQHLKNTSFYLLNMPDDNYVLEWWDTWTGEVIEETGGSSVGGQLLIEVSELDRDIAVNIRSGEFIPAPDIKSILFGLTAAGLAAFIGVMSYKYLRASKAEKGLSEKNPPQERGTP